MKPEYSSIGRTLHLRARVADLSGQEKVNLFQFLLEELGILQRFQREPDETARAQEIIAEQWHVHWSK